MSHAINSLIFTFDTALGIFGHKKLPSLSSTAQSKILISLGKELIVIDQCKIYVFEDDEVKQVKDSE